MLPAVAVAGPDFTTETSTDETSSPELDESFSGVGSLSDVTEAVLVKSVPEGVPVGICPTSVKFAVAFAANEADVQVIVPPAPTAGVVQLSAGPEVWLRETNVIVPGSGSVSETVVAAFGPAFERVIV